MPERLRWAVDGVLAERPRAVLEVGCGRGVALALLADAVDVVHGLDRSATAVQACRLRLAEQVRAGRVLLHHGDWADVDVAPVDLVLAVDVNVLWTRDPGPELAAVRRVLAPGGALHAVHAPPGGRTDEVQQRVSDALVRHGFAVTAERRGDLLRVVGHPL